MHNALLSCLRMDKLKFLGDERVGWFTLSLAFRAGGGLMPILMDDVTPSPEWPSRVNIVIIGGGIIGIATAMFLAERGISVAVCEKGRVGHEQSGRNWGWVRVMGREVSEIPAALESQKLWEGMEKRIGADVGFRRSGIVYVADSDALLEKHAAWLEAARPFQTGTRLLTRQETEALLPGAAARYKGALITPNDGRAEPQKAVPAMATYVQRLGGFVLEHCAVRGLDRSAGRVSGVITEKGRIACDRVILCTGAWSRLFLGNLGIDFPQLKIQGSVMRTAPLDGPPSFAVGGSDFAFRKRADGGYSIAHRGASVAHIVPDSFRLFADFVPAFIRQRHEVRLKFAGRFMEEARYPRHWGMDEITPFERVRTLDPKPDQAILAEAQRNLVHAFPAFRDMTIAGAWAGLIDVMPDAVPVMGEVPNLPGFFLATGFSGHGFGIGPGAGRVIADMVTGVDPSVDMKPFQLSRSERLRRTAMA